MTEIQNREFEWGGVRSGKVFLDSEQTLRAPAWTSFRRDVTSCGINGVIFDLEEVFVASDRSWRRLVFMPQINQEQLAKVKARPEYGEAKHDLLALRKLFIDARNSNGH